MIFLTKLDNTEVLINLESIKYIESTPDSLVRFLNGDTIIVRENLQEIEKRVVEWKHKYLRTAIAE